MRIIQIFCSSLLRSEIREIIPSHLRHGSRVFVLTAVVLPLLLSAVRTTFAGSATWKSNPASRDWNTANNWMPETVPNSASDTAVFDLSNKINIFLSASTEVNGIAFSAGASPFTITANPTTELSISGVGIQNNSGIAQNFVAAVDHFRNVGLITLSGTATADTGTFTNNGGIIRGSSGGQTLFTGSSTAGDASFTNNGAAARFANGGFTVFTDNSTAGSGTFINNGGVSGYARGGGTLFRDASTAGNGTFTNNDTVAYKGGGGSVIFDGSSTAGNGTFINNAFAERFSGGGIKFNDTATAGNGTFITTNGAIEFIGSSTAGNGNFTINGFGFVRFFQSSTAADGTFTNNGGFISFSTKSTAGNGTFINNNGGRTFFAGMSTASHATLIANGGSGGAPGGKISLVGNSRGGTARVEVFGNGILDISFRHKDVTIGSIEGDGHVSLQFANLTVGSNELNTTFSGVISDGGFTSSLIKIGGGKLSLNNANSYTGLTAINLGKLLVNNKGGSGTGSGPVRVNAGTLGGIGIIAGPVTVGTGSGPGAVLSPGRYRLKPGTLTIESGLIFNSDATYNLRLNSKTAIADKVVANGVTISGALFSLADLAGNTLLPGTVFTVIDNTAATPIAGTFSNLADGATFMIGRNNFQANYKGGGGNDLTLTVLP